jgi:large subunit ribosomal protein L15
MPIFRRLPKRGFSNFNFRRPYETVNVAVLEKRFEDGDIVDLDVLRKFRLIQNRSPRVKILAKGALGKKLTVEAHAFSAKARAAIEQAGGTVKVVAQLDRAKAARGKRNAARARAEDTKPTRLEKKARRKQDD